jgi:hypothetical protein
MQDELQDLMEESNEVQELLARSYSTPDYVDEADLEAGKAFRTALEAQVIFCFWM